MEQAYTVQSGDYPVKVATLYDVDVDELRNFNQWEADYSDFPSVGETVRIPPGAKFINPNAPETTEAGTEDTETTGGEDDESTSSTVLGGPCDPGTYTLEEGDYPGRGGEEVRRDASRRSTRPTRRRRATPPSTSASTSSSPRPPTASKTARSCISSGALERNE